MPRRREPAGPRATNAPTPTSTGAGVGALRGLVGAGASQVGVVGALRARDVSRPAPDDVRHALDKPEPIARPAAHHEAPGRQDAPGSGNAGGTSVSS